VDFSGFLSGLLSGLVSSAVAGAAVLYLGYRWIEQKLRLQDEADRRRELASQREESRIAALRAVHAELEASAGLLQTLLEQLSVGAVPFPGFDLNFWPLVVQAEIFTTLGHETIFELTSAYNRMKTANQQLAFLADLNHGSTAIMVTATSAGRTGDPEVASAYQGFEDHRHFVRLGLLERLKELKPHLDAAIDRIEADINKRGEVPAAQRAYALSHPPGEIGQHS
jgi:hypothetical protein